MNSQSRVKIQVWLMIVVVFLLGGVTGAALDRILLRPGSEKMAPDKDSRGPNRFVNKLTKELTLRPDQEKAIRDIFEGNRKEFRTRMTDCPGLKEMRQQTDARIKEILTPDQRIKFDQFTAQREAEMKQREAEGKYK